ncbi:RsmB/NOP family class I SAM-dependent RNA methyltransferase [Salinibius halmophilus]|uniref:RsmB/NOP family class I SAM-dependent RNA methyltransferase n=1 Tax=Salinibius halmophilus TaxID=1853216 RepID=UPI000E66DD47|nr:RsmB/NOP family class I SAM-dependent RNA methyltransferase [Salinibius halmophilus]
MHALNRYQDIVDDWQLFMAACEQPLPATIWTNPLRTSADELEGWLKRYQLDYQSIPYIEGGFEFAHDAPVGRLFPWHAGWYHVQEGVSMMAAAILAPKSGMRVLDMCAAPGGKTAQMATMMAGAGMVFANDLTLARIKALRGTLNRMGIANVISTVQDASKIADDWQQFDAIMADVPCSCEGNLRRNAKVLNKRHNRKYLTQLQQKILLNAFARAKVGANIVYSTCTFAPEENECVLHEVLTQLEGKLEMTTIDLPGAQAQAGLTYWQGQSLHPDIAKAWRIWPHHNNSGGFFIAKLTKVAA